MASRSSLGSILGFNEPFGVLFFSLRSITYYISHASGGGEEQLGAVISHEVNPSRTGLAGQECVIRKL